jgi:hypothetical protein
MANEKTETKKFAENFVPTFSASKLGEFCNANQTEKSKIKFLAQFKPFSELLFTVSDSPKDCKSVKSEKKKPPAKSTLLDQNEKEKLKQILDESINTDRLTFDDDRVIEKFKKSSSREQKDFEIENIQSLLNQLNFQDENARDSFYETATSDEETFKKESKSIIIKEEECEDGDEILKSKMTQVTRYVSFMRGRKLEDHIVNKINRDRNENFEKDKRRKTVDFGLFKVVGIVDGIDRESGKILEIKTRKSLNKKDPNNNDEKVTISNKERKQAMVYMKMHECKSCLFVEVGQDGRLKESIIEWDEDEFNNEIRAKLEDFCHFARQLSQDEFKTLIEKHQLSPFL